MRKRAIAASVVSSSAVILIGWQIGAQAQSADTSLSAAAPARTSAAPATSSPQSSARASTTPTATPEPSTAASAPSATSAPSESPSAASTDGTYTGSSVNTRYGTVQVQITVSAGSITDVTALQLTDSDSRSVQISNRAAPVLRQEVLAAQSANVDSVSGATYTSDGYLKSLQSALDQAGL
ncbi:MAG: FMN-binding protein [Subtercola sp.]|nr:FMN-binding protein [Subtercola sp.]